MPDNPEAFDSLADLYLTVYQADPEQYAKFLDDLETLAKKAENNHIKPLAIYRARGFVALARGDAQKGIEYLRQAYSLNPSDRRVILGLAGALSGRGDYAEAEKIASTALKKTPLSARSTIFYTSTTCARERIRTPLALFAASAKPTQRT